MKIDTEGKYADNHRMFALKFCFEKDEDLKLLWMGGKNALCHWLLVTFPIGMTVLLTDVWFFFFFFLVQYIIADDSLLFKISGIMMIQMFFK